MQGNNDNQIDTALQLIAQGDYKRAKSLLLDSYQRFPDEKYCLFALGVIGFYQNNDKEALNYLSEYLKDNPHNKRFDTYMMMAMIYQRHRKYQSAVDFYLNALAIKGDEAICFNNLGQAYEPLGEYEKALSCYHDAIRCDPNYADAYNNLGLIMKAKGDKEKAKSAFLKALAIKPDFVEVHRHLSLVNHYKEGDEHLEKMRLLEANNELKDHERMQLGFALGKAFEELGDYDRAFHYFDRANKIRFQTLDYNIDSDKELFDNIRQIFNKDMMDYFREDVSNDDTPIFVVGMMRSGTSLVEQILSTHSSVYGAGELIKMNELVYQYFVKATRAKPAYHFVEPLGNTIKDIGTAYLAHLKTKSNLPRIVDKMPLNFRWLALIHLALPNAKLIHCVRNPKDTCLSIYKNYFRSPSNAYAYDINALAKFYGLYRELMNYWHEIMPGTIYDISYDALVNEPDTEIRRLLDACDLPYDENCLNFHENMRIVKTVSANQVRQPMYKTSSHSYKHYEKQLSALFEQLD